MTKLPRDTFAVIELSLKDPDGGVVQQHALSITTGTPGLGVAGTETARAMAEFSALIAWYIEAGNVANSLTAPSRWARTGRARQRSAK